MVILFSNLVIATIYGIRDKPFETYQLKMVQASNHRSVCKAIISTNVLYKIVEANVNYVCSGALYEATLFSKEQERRVHSRAETKWVSSSTKYA